jgi:hypothetical protein
MFDSSNGLPRLSGRPTTKVQYKMGYSYRIDRAPELGGERAQK